MPEEEPVSIVDLITEGVDVPDELPSIDEFVPPRAKSERAAVPDRAATGSTASPTAAPPSANRAESPAALA